MTNEEYEKIKAGAKFIRVGTKEICTYLCDLKTCICGFKFAAKIMYEDFESVCMLDSTECIELLKTKYVRYINMNNPALKHIIYMSEAEARDYQYAPTPVARIEWEE